MLIQVVAATGQTVYVFIWNALGQIWNGTSFVTYVQANWATYVISAVEQAGSGSYFATVPSGITTAGTYSFAGYIQLHGSPASGDTPVAQGPFTIPPAVSTFIVPATLAGLITDLRILVEDAPDSKIVYGEQLGLSDQPMFPVNGVNKNFRLKKPLLSDYVGSALYTWVTVVGTGAVARTQVGFTIADQINGVISFTSAPDPGGGTYPTAPPNGVYVDYNYEWFSDAKYAQFLYQAAQMTLAGTTDPTTIPNGLTDAMLQYGVYLTFTALAGRFAQEFASSGGEAHADAQQPAQVYRSLAKDAKANADQLKKDFYMRQGQREAPAFVNPTSFPPSRFDRITPRR
jgi:hypothetical protein